MAASRDSRGKTAKFKAGATKSAIFERGPAELEHREHIRAFIGTMAAELAKLALDSGLDALAVACDVTREVAEGNVESPARRVDCN